MTEFHNVLHILIAACAAVMVFDGLRRKDAVQVSFGLCTALFAALQILQITGWTGAALSAFQVLASLIVLTFGLRRIFKGRKRATP